MKKPGRGLFRRRARQEATRSEGRRIIQERLGASYETLPPVIERSEKVEESIRGFLAQHQVPETLDVSISRNDLMFLNSLGRLELEDAYRAYLEIGLNGRNIVRKLAEHRFGAVENVDALLDFASGYGRVSRFLVLDFPPPASGFPT